jgi:hypothetical protein
MTEGETARMTTGDRRWAKYGKAGAVAAFVVALVVGAANLDGFLSMIDRVTGSDEPAQTTQAPDPQQALSGTTSPQPSAATEPAPAPATVVADPTPAVTPKQRVTPNQPPVAAPEPTRAGALVVTIRMGSGGKIGPSEYRAGATPGANVDVFDDVGQLSAGCYPSWVLTRQGAEVQKIRNGRCTSGGITMFNFKDSLDQPGDYRLAVSIQTDSGQTGGGSVDFVVR